MTVDLSTFYILEKAGERGSFSAKCMAAETADAQLKLLERLLCGIEIPKMPIKFFWGEGSRLYDILLSTLPSYLASSRVFDALIAADTTGSSRYPIELHGKANELIEGFSGLVVTGRSGPLQLGRSRVETRVGASGKHYKVKTGLYFDEGTWDGSDVFTPRGTTFVFGTEKVRRALQSAKISNVKFTRLIDFERQW